MDRRQFFRRTSVGLAVTFAAVNARQGQQATVDLRSQIERLMTRLHEQRLFTGEILVAEKGCVIYEGAFGVADRRQGGRIRSALARVWRRSRSPSRPWRS
jgi:hypothetical protein